jgi:pimeloyl-ACP methyl ester carboxylesterase
VSPLLGRLVTPLQIRQLFTPEPVPTAFREAVPLGMMLSLWQLRAGAAEAALMMPAVRALASRFGELHLPVTVVAGGEDRIVDPQAHAVRLHGTLPGSQLMLLLGQGHRLHYAEAERLEAAVHALFAARETQAPSAERGQFAVTPTPSERVNETAN